MDFFTSDLHLFHKKICEFTDRKLVTTQEQHEEWLIKLWNKQVKDNDTVYILGDVSFGKHDETASALNQMNGRKIVIKGNHDDAKNLIRLQANLVIQEWHQYREIKILGTTTCLFHFPIGSWFKQAHGSWHLHGHSHGAYADSRGKMLDVGIDSSYNIFGEHKLFTQEDIKIAMDSKAVYVADEHREVR